MSAYVARVFRTKENCSRSQDQTYVHVVNGFQSLSGTGVNSLADWLALHPESPWLDEEYNEYVVELTYAEYLGYSVGGALGVYYDAMTNLPKWQQLAGNTGSTRNIGNYADPTDDQSTFTTGIQLIDDRFILRVFDLDPVANPTTAVHIGEEEFDETPEPSNIITRYIQAFNELDVARNWNMADARTSVGGKLMDFDWGSSHDPALSAGVTSFKVDIQRTGTIWFMSNHIYRFVGPLDGDPKYYKAEIYGKILRAPIES